MTQTIIPSLNIGLGQYCQSISYEFFEHISKYDQSLAKMTVNGALVVEEDKIVFNDENGKSIYDFSIERNNENDIFSLDEENQKMFRVAVSNLYFNTLRLKNALVPDGFGIEGGRIFVHLFIPLFDNSCVPLLNYFLSAFEAGRKNGQFSGFAVRIFALTHRVVSYGNSKKDIKKEIEYGLNTEKNIRQIKSLYEQYEDSFHNLFVIDDINRNHLKLDLNETGLAIVLNEIVLASMLNPYIFGKVRFENHIGSIGVGIIQLDKFLVEDYFKANVLKAGFEKEELLKDSQVKSDYIINETNKFLGDKLSLFTEHLESAKDEIFPVSFYEFFIENVPDLDKVNAFDSLKKLSERFHAEKTDTAIVESDDLAKQKISGLEKEINTFTDLFNDNIIKYKILLGNLINEQSHAKGYNNLDYRYTYDDLKHNSFDFFISLLPEKNQVSRKHLNKIQNDILNLEEHIKQLDKEKEQLGTIKLHPATDNFLFDQGIFTVSGKKMNANNFIPNSAENDFSFFDVKKNQVLPEIVNLKEFFSTVENQQDLPVASAYAVCAVYDYFLKRNGIDISTSRSFLYQTVQNKNQELHDSTKGIGLEDAIQQLIDTGVCKENLWPNTRENFKTTPTEEAIDDAVNHRLKKAARLHLNEYEFKSVIAKGLPVIIGLKVFKSFFDAADFGIVPTPRLSEIDSEKFGFHPMVVVGYSENDKHFLVRNSWGSAFGDKGYCYLPYTYVLDSRFCKAAYIFEEIINLSSKFQFENNSLTSFFKTEKVEIKRNIVEYYLEKYNRKLSRSKKRFHEFEKNYQNIISQIRDPIFQKHLLEEKLNHLTERKKSLLDDFKNRFSLNQLEKKAKKNLWGASGLFIIALLAVFVLLVLGLIPLIGYLFIPIIIVAGVWAFFPLKKMKRNSIDVSKMPIRKKELLGAMAKELGDIEDEIQKLKVQFKYSAMLMEEAEKLMLKLFKQHSFTINFINKLLDWYHSEYSSLIPARFDSPVFVIELAKQDVLKSYFDSQKISLLENWPSVTDFFNQEFQKISNSDNHIILDEALNKSIQNLEFFIQHEVKRFDDFDIQAYLLGKKKYDWLPPVENYLNSFVDNMDDMSMPFIQVVEGNVKQPEIDTCLLISESDDYEEEFISLINQNFSHNPPQPVKIFSGHKVSFLKIETGLRIDELVVAQEKH